MHSRGFKYDTAVSKRSGSSNTNKDLQLSCIYLLAELSSLQMGKGILYGLKNKSRPKKRNLQPSAGTIVSGTLRRKNWMAYIKRKR